MNPKNNLSADYRVYSCRIGVFHTKCTKLAPIDVDEVLESNCLLVPIPKYIPKMFDRFVLKWKLSPPVSIAR